MWGFPIWKHTVTHPHLSTPLKRISGRNSNMPQMAGALLWLRQLIFLKALEMERLGCFWSLAQCPFFLVSKVVVKEDSRLQQQHTWGLPASFVWVFARKVMQDLPGFVSVPPEVLPAIRSFAAARPIVAFTWFSMCCCPSCACNQCQPNPPATLNPTARETKVLKLWPWTKPHAHINQTPTLGPGANLKPTSEQRKLESLNQTQTIPYEHLRAMPQTSS